MRKEKRTAAYSAIAAIIALIAVIGVMNYYASGYDKAVGLQGPSFLSTFLIIVGGVAGCVVIFVLFCVVVMALLDRPRLNRRAMK